MMARVARAHRSAAYEVPPVPRLACAERLAICREAGDVSEERAQRLAEDDARRCAEGGRLCVCG